MDQTQRARFYEGQYLGAEDLTALASYPRVQQARHDLGAHTWGIAVGLDIVERTLPSGDVENVVTPGYAWDGYGRPVVVLAPTKILADKLVNFQGTTPVEGVLVKVWLRYDEEETKNPSSGFEVCGPKNQHARVVETFAIEVGEPKLGPHDQVTVAGSAIDAVAALSTFDKNAPALFDESVAFQEFPEDDERRWLIPLGYVRWQKLVSQPGRFVPRDDGGTVKDSDIIRELRHYVGAVAETIHAADGVIRLRDRSKDPDPAKSHFHPPKVTSDPTNPDDLVWIEGSLRVQGDTRIAGGQLELRRAKGLDGDTPTVLRRRGDAGKPDAEVGGRRLEAIVGKEDQTGDDASRFAVGPLLDTGDLAERLTVLSTGNVGIGNAEPFARLHLKSLTVVDQGGGPAWANFGSNATYDGSWKQVDIARAGVNLHMSAESDGKEFRFLRVEANGNNLRNIAVLGSEASWIRGGNLGIGNTSPAAQVHIKTMTMLDEGTDANGLWASFGLNSSFDGGWHRIDDEAAGVNLRMNGDADGQQFRFSRTTAQGSRSDIAVLGTETSYVAEGRLGVGTSSPAAKLDVSGRILRHGQEFSFINVANDQELVFVPWGTTDDWNLFVSPRTFGKETFDPVLDPDAAVAAIKCHADPDPSKVGYRVTIQFRMLGSTGFQGGTANYIWVPR